MTPIPNHGPKFGRNLNGIRNSGRKVQLRNDTEVKGITIAQGETKQYKTTVPAFRKLFVFVSNDGDVSVFTSYNKKKPVLVEELNDCGRVGSPSSSCLSVVLE